MSNATIRKIHREFDTASDRLINAANAIIAKGFYADAMEAEKLKEMGFTGCKEVKRMKVLSAIKSDGDLAQSYAVAYPQYKFITKPEIDRICKKYGLLFGSSDRYIGDIPKKNMKEIVSFNVKDEHLEVNIDSMFSFTFYSSFLERSRSEEEKAADAAKKEAEKEKNKYNRKLSICATRNMMNMKNAKLDGHEIKEIVKDPIVLHPVKGGFLIVSKWGIEGEDEALTNETMN